MKIETLAVAIGLMLVGPAIARNEAPQPYKVVMESDPGLSTHTVYRPEALDGLGQTRLPVVAWANGGCANRGDRFATFLTEIASHGFLVVAIGPAGGSTSAPPPPPTGASGAIRMPDLNAPPQTTSSQLIDAINWAIAENARPASRYHGRIDVKNIAVMGQSCGGLQAIEASADPRVVTTMVWNSGVLGVGPGGLPGAKVTKDSLKALHGPVAYISGDASDVAFANAEDDFARLTHVPVFRGYQDGVGHMGTYSQPRGGAFGKVAVAWLSWQLKGDPDSKAMFVGPACGLCAAPSWRVQAKNLEP